MVASLSKLCVNNLFSLLAGPLIIYAQIYTLYSVFVICKEIKAQKKGDSPLHKELLTFYYGHILNVIVFNLTWIIA